MGTSVLCVCVGPWRGGGYLGPNYAQMCVSKSEGHGSVLSYKGVK